MRTKSHCVKVDPWHSIKLLKPVYHSQTHCGLKLSSKMQAGTLLDHSLVRSDKLQHKTMEKIIDICLAGVWKWFWAKSFIQSFWRSSRTELCHFLWRPHCLLEDGRIQADSSLISFFDQGKVLWFIASLCGIEYILVTIFQMHLSFVCFWLCVCVYLYVCTCVCVYTKQFPRGYSKPPPT